VRLGFPQARRVIREALVHEGVTPEAAELQAHWLVEAELRGHASHGIQRLPVLLERTRRRLIDPAATPRLDWISDSAIVVEGNRALGPWVGVQAVDALSERAPETGVAVAAVRNANHLGLLSLYVERAAEAGLIGVALTTSEALVHPWGGSEALVGTNPIAVGVPASPHPFVVDMATSEISMGKVLAHRHHQTPLDPRWAVDSRGRPTTDPSAVAALSPFGGAKGYGLALAFELLVATLSATALGTRVTGTLDVEHPATKGDLFVCFAPARFGESDATRAAVDDYLEELRRSPAVDASTPVAVPGDRARARREAALREGINLPHELVAELRGALQASEIVP
jgi:L-2-hydroxycarboxylate dehydrogenase (NAD+)